MTEPATTDPVVEPTGDPATGDPEPVSFVNPDGTFKEGWQDAFVPEDFRGRTMFSSFTSVGDVMKKVGNQELVLSRGGKMPSPLPENATATEKDEYYKALGRPESPKEYELAVPDEIKDFVQPELMEKGRELFHAMGLNKQQAQLAWKFEQERIQSGLEEMARTAKADREATQNALEKKWGPDAYAERMHFAKRLVQENTTDENREQLLEAIGHNQHILEFVAEFGMKFKEAGRIDSDGAQKPVMTKEEHQMKAKELMETPGYINGSLTPAQMERLQKEIRAHYAAMEE